MTRHAVIDCGTNSVKFHVAELEPEGIWTTTLDRAEVTRLGEGLQQAGTLAPEAMTRTARAISEMCAEAARLGAEQITAVGTMGLRTASNRQEFLDLVEKECGLSIEVISGADESRVAYLAVQSPLGLVDADLVIFDTGGGSTQFTIGKGRQVDRQFSLNVGAVRYTEQFRLQAAVSDQVLEQVFDQLAADLGAIDDVPPPQVLVGMGGAVTNLTAVMYEMARYDPDVVQGATLNRAEVERQIQRYRSLSAAERKQIVGLQPNRAEVILAGACIIRTVMDKLRMPWLTVSDRGLRHGILIDRFGGRLRPAGRSA